ncbi:MAG: DNA primase [Bdellovibrionia bacterium]
MSSQIKAPNELPILKGSTQSTGSSNTKKGKLAPELLEKIKSSVNIIEIIGEHVVLRKSGANYNGLCPLHSERSPSFSVNEIKQLYHCYGCKAGGDVVTFVMAVLGVSFQEAVEELADRGKVALPGDWQGKSDDPAQESKNIAQREKLATAYKLNRFSAAFYHQRLSSHPRALEYFKNRGVGVDLSQSFYLGASPDSWDALASHLVSKQAPLNLATELGLIRPSIKEGGLKRGPGYFDLFRNRAIFPIVNLRGKVAGFGGRVLGEDTPKYLNSLESLVFQKGKLAFGLYQAQKYIREKDEVILVEGYFDVLAMHAAGFQNTVATCGTSLTPEHLAILGRFCSRIIILFDGDQAGVSATERAMEIGLDQGCVLFGAQMPKDLDPDEILFDPQSGRFRPEGYEQMSAILKSASALLDSEIESAIRTSGQSPEDKTLALKKIGKWLGRFKDPIGREVRMQMVHEQMGISMRLLQDALGKEKSALGKERPALERNNSAAQVIRPNGPIKPARVIKGNKVGKASKAVEMGQLDRILLAGIFAGGRCLELFLDAANRLPPQTIQIELFDYVPAKEFISTLLVDSDSLERLRISPKSLLINGLDEKIRIALTSSLVALEPEKGPDDFQLALSKSIAKVWARFSQRIKIAISEAEIGKDTDLQARLMKEYLDVQRKMKEFSSFYDEA